MSQVQAKDLLTSVPIVPIPVSVSETTIVAVYHLQAVSHDVALKI